MIDSINQWFSRHPYTIASAIFMVLAVFGWRVLGWGERQLGFLLLLYFIITLGAMRFSGESGMFKISRETAMEFSIEDLSRICPVDEIEGIALCYSMGDNISSITDIRKVKNRGIISREGAGQHIGGGTKDFDEVAKSKIPAIVIPGLHRGSPTDSRFKAYSHQASPEKIGIAYEVTRVLGDDVVVSDVSSNTVTLLISAGKLVGAFDACIFAPGSLHRCTRCGRDTADRCRGVHGK